MMPLESMRYQFLESSWPCLTRPSTPFSRRSFKRTHVDARVKPTAVRFKGGPLPHAPAVMPVRVAGIHEFSGTLGISKTWIAGTGPAMTRRATVRRTESRSSRQRASARNPPRSRTGVRAQPDSRGTGPRIHVRPFEIPPRERRGWPCPIPGSSPGTAMTIWGN